MQKVISLVKIQKQIKNGTIFWGFKFLGARDFLGTEINRKAEAKKFFYSLAGAV